MKRCENCFENNSDGATNCVICGETLDVPQMAGEAGSDTFGGEVGSEIPREISDAAVEEATETSDIAIAVEEQLDDDDYRAYTEMADDDPDIGPIEVVQDNDWESAVIGSGEGSSVYVAGDSSLVAPEVAMDETPEVGSTPSETAMNGAPVEAGQVVIQVFHDEDPRIVHNHVLSRAHIVC